MTGSHSRFRAIAWLLALAALAICASGKDKKEEILPDYSRLMKLQQEFQRSFQFMPGGRLHIHTGFMGNVKISGWDKPSVMVDGVITAWGSDHAALLRNMEAIQPKFSKNEASINIQTQHAEKFNLGKIDYEIKVPRYRTDIVIKTHIGFIELRNINGWVEADTIKGFVSMVDMSGYLSVTTKEGDLMAQLKGHRWEGLQLSAKTEKGDVKLYMPSNYSTDLTLITENGQITSDYPPFQFEEEEVPIAIKEKKKGAFITQMIREGGPNVVLATELGQVKLIKFAADTEYLEASPSKPATPAEGEKHD